MNYIRHVAAAAAALSFAAISSVAPAANVYYVKNVSINPNGPQLTLSNSVDSGSFLAGAIGLDIANSPTGTPFKTLWVFCVDLIHEIGLGGQSPPLPYVFSPVTTNSAGSQSGTGAALGLGVSNQIGALAALGASIASGPSAGADGKELEAIQGAIWKIEYGGSVTSGDMTEDGLISSYVTYAQTHPAATDAEGFYPLGTGGEGFGTSQGFSPGIPEPASWAIMIVGLAGIGAVARNRRGASVTL